MPKGKKFDAAEKHFQKKEELYKSMIKGLTQQIEELKVISVNQAEQIESLLAENQQLKLENKKLLEYTNLDPADVKAACEKDKKTAEAVSLVGSALKYSGFTSFL